MPLVLVIEWRHYAWRSDEGEQLLDQRKVREMATPWQEGDGVACGRARVPLHLAHADNDDGLAITRKCVSLGAPTEVPFRCDVAVTVRLIHVDTAIHVMTRVVPFLLSNE